MRRKNENKLGYIYIILAFQMLLTIIGVGTYFIMTVVNEDFKRSFTAVLDNIRDQYSGTEETDHVSELMDLIDENAIGGTGIEIAPQEAEFYEVPSYASFSPYEIFGIKTMPVDGALTSEFGFREFLGEIEFHTGIDIAATENTEIYAAFTGIIIESDYSDILGNYVVIQHDGNIVTTYGHMNESLVTVGDEVLSGDLIGLVGTTGRSTGYHLHFEIKIGDKYFNPLEVFEYV